MYSPLYYQEPGAVPGIEKIYYEGINGKKKMNESTQPSTRRRKQKLLCIYSLKGGEKSTKRFFK